MRYEDHLENTRQGDGYDPAAAVEARMAELTAELADDPDVRETHARKIATQERRSFESSNRNHLKKQFSEAQGVLGLDFEAFVPLGDNVMVKLGKMNDDRIALRIELIDGQHFDHSKAWTLEREFWLRWRENLGPGDKLEDL